MPLFSHKWRSTTRSTTRKWPNHRGTRIAVALILAMVATTREWPYHPGRVPLTAHRHHKKSRTRMAVIAARVVAALMAKRRTRKLPYRPLAAQ